MNSSEEVLKSFDKLSGYKKEIDSIVSQITEGEQLFGSISIQLNFEGIFECCFQRIISWLYTLYWEAGKKSDIKFLVELFDAFNLDKSKNLSNHFYIVQSLRTLLQHNVANEDTHNSKVRRNCSEWFESICRVSYPENDSDWEKCVNKLIYDAQSFLEAILKCIHSIECDESKDAIVYQWNIRRKRYFSPWDYDNLIREVIGDLGITKDVAKIRTRYQSKWNEFLRNLSINSDFKFELKKLILNTLLEDQEMLMPIITDDIILEFDIPAGSPEIYGLLAKAKKIYKSTPELTKKEILEKLRADL
ncbi:hypothetical protein [Nostoc sp. 2RC]|uniref:hypothetical protein n=1 Tax=Nostoc sp. 2RC TaxID=2485484 RepID=UPI001623CA82|nr:hypothetical protein [Nostoc sp. 2RC]MBC1237223.1 hypothetical protein [Nostoc sp. 2RC]